MRRLLRILFNAVAILSLLLCVATVVLWVRSYDVQETLHCRRSHQHSAWIASSQGQVALLHITLSGNSSFYRSPGAAALFLRQCEPSKLTGAFWLDPGAARSGR